MKQKKEILPYDIVLLLYLLIISLISKLRLNKAFLLLNDYINGNK